MKKKEFSPPPASTQAPSANLIAAIAAQVADKPLSQIKNTELSYAADEKLKTELPNWTSCSDEGLKPLFTFRAPEQVADLLSVVSENTGFSQNDITLESSWTFCLASVLNECSDNDEVRDLIKQCIQKNRKRWRGRTLEDALNEQIQLLNSLKRLIDE